MSPKTLGRYEIIGELGKGAMGLVYLARDPLIGRQLALKTFQMGLSAGDEELGQFRARFLREAQSAGILSHPNIVTIHDVVVSEDGSIVIAMEYVKGTDLKILMQRQRQGRLDQRFVIDVVAQIADGLDYAHSKGVIHRDIKPANVIITAEKQAKITDFGIARVDTSNLTTEGQLLGTPNYMSPEQIQGKEVDHRTDLFSLGVMLYEMLTRKKPFAGENLTAVTHRIVYDDFPPPDDVVPGLSPKLIEILDRALRKDPEERYSKGGEMAEELRAVLAPPAASGPPSRASGSFLVRGPADGSAGPPETIRPAGPAPGPDAICAGTPVAGGATSNRPATGVGTVPAAPPPAAEATLEKGGGGRTALVAGVVLALLLGVGGFLAFSMRDGRNAGPTDTGPPPAGTEQPASPAQVALEEGERLLETGDPRAALEVLDPAVARAPDNRELRALRQRAEEAVLVLDGRDPQEAMIATRLSQGREALRERDYREAIRRVEEVLDVDPEHAEAQDLLEQAQEGLRRRDEVRDRFRRQGAAPPPEGAGDTTAAEGSATERTAPAVQVPVKLDFFSEVSQGRLTIYNGLEPIYREAFEFESGRSGFLSRSRKTSGRLSGSFELPAGEVQIKVYAWLKDSQETTSTQIRAELAAGGSPTLAVRLLEDGLLTAELQ